MASVVVRTAQEFHDVMISAALAPERRKEILIKIAKEKLGEVEARQGVFPYTREIDGIMDRREEDVKPDGRIVYFIHAYKMVFNDLIEMLMARSPVGDKSSGLARKGAYRNVHFRDMWKVIVNGIEIIPVDMLSQRPPKPGEVWWFVNVMPYTRKIVRGTRNHPEGISVKAPVPWVEIIATTFYRKYQNFLEAGVRGKGRGLRFEYVQPPAAAFDVGGLRGPSERGKQWLDDTRYPAIVVEIPANAWTGVR